MLSMLTGSVLTLVGLLTLVSLLLYRYATQTYGYWRRKRVPFVPPTPLFGNFYPVVVLRAGIGHFLADLYTRMSDHKFFGVWIFRTPHLIVRDPELVKAVLLKDFEYFSDRTIVSEAHIDPIGANLLFLEKNPGWRESRKRLTPAFTSGKIKAMVPLINQCADEMKAYMDKLIAQSGTMTADIEAKEMVAKLTTSVISSCVFGLEARCFDTEDSKFREVGRQMFDLDLENAVRSISYFFLPGLVSLFKFSFAKPGVFTFLRDVFMQTIEHRELHQNKRNDLVDMLVQVRNEDRLNGGNTDNDKIAAHAIQFFIAGFETTSSTISYALYEMCLDEDKQDKLRADIYSNIRQFGGATYDAVMNMKYLDNCVSETLRKYPVLPFLDRRCMKDYTLPGTDVTIEKGTPVYISMFGLHYDPKYFPDPEAFDPDRFSEANSRARPPFSYIPFGQGPHNCIGERFGLVSTKLGLVHILMNYEVRRNAQTPVPIVFDPKTFLLQSTVGVPMTFSPVNPRKMSMTTG